MRVFFLVKSLSPCVGQSFTSKQPFTSSSSQVIPNGFHSQTHVEWSLTAQAPAGMTTYGRLLPPVCTLRRHKLLVHETVATNVHVQGQVRSRCSPPARVHSFMSHIPPFDSS